MTTEEFVNSTIALEQRLISDQIVSDDIKQLASSVRLLAEFVKDSRDSIEAMAETITATAETVVALQQRPAKNITVNYGTK